MRYKNMEKSRNKCRNCHTKTLMIEKINLINKDSNLNLTIDVLNIKEILPNCINCRNYLDSATYY